MIVLALILALVPGILVFMAIYKFDTIEKEPASLLLKLFAGGVVACAVSDLAGGLGRSILQSVYAGRNLMLFQFVDSFLLNALLEQILIFAVVIIFTWKGKEFNYTFDAVVYTVTASLGLTLTGNLLHIYRNGGAFKVSILLLSLVGHMISAVFMGYFYGSAKNAEGAGNRKAQRLQLAEALLVPTVMFGVYDFCMQIQLMVFYIIFIVYEFVCAVLTIREIIYLSTHDAPLTGLEDVKLSKQDTIEAEQAERW